MAKPRAAKMLMWRLYLTLWVTIGVMLLIRESCSTGYQVIQSITGKLLGGAWAPGPHLLRGPCSRLKRSGCQDFCLWGRERFCHKM